MQKVQGFGGFFFRAHDPEALTKWCLDHLGISPVPASVEQMLWIADGGATIFAPFLADTDYFAGGKAFMLNFRVADMDGMLEQLREAGIDVSHESVMEGVGRFARIHDPEGNPVELWQPVG